MSFNFLLCAQDNLQILQDGSDVITWHQLKHHIAGIQTQLIENKVQNCVLLSKDNLTFVACLLACHYLAVDLILPPNETDEMMELLEKHILIGDHPNSVSYELKNDEIINKHQDSKLSIFTSGSTGTPKLITREFSQMMLEVKEINQMWGQEFKSPLFVSTVSSQHIYGLLFALLWPLSQGCRIHRKIIPFEESLGKLCLLNTELVLISSPAFLKRLSLRNNLINNHMDVFCSGGMLNKSQSVKASKLLNCAIIQVYGSSETGGIAYKFQANDWQFFPSVKTNISNKTLKVKSPFCYITGWLDTNDKIRMTNSGFELLGRKDRIVKIEEKRVSLVQVEREIKNHCWVNDALAIAMIDGRQFIAIIIVLNKQGKLKLHELGVKNIKLNIKNFVKPKLDKLAIPRQIRFMNEIPQNTQGKTPYPIIRALFET